VTGSDHEGDGGCPPWDTYLRDYKEQRKDVLYASVSQDKPLSLETTVQDVEYGELLKMRGITVDSTVILQLQRWKSGEDPPMWQGAVPDMSKLQASTQVDTYGLWWRGSKCDLCEYEADRFGPIGYRCRLHEDMIIGDKPE